MSKEDKKIDIILVDDDDVVLTLMARALSNTFHEVRTADSGAKALELMKEKPADLVVTDIRMPEMSGVELLELIKKDYQDTLVIVITVEDAVDITEECMKRGAIYYLQKPIDFKTLRTAVNIAVEKVHLKEKVKITDKEVETKLAEEEEETPSKPKNLITKKDKKTLFFRRIFQRCPVPLVAFDFDSGKIEHINDDFLEKTGFTAEELIGRGLVESSLVTKELVESVYAKLEEDQSLRNIDAVIKGKDGGDITGKINTSVLKREMGQLVIWALV